MEIPDEALLGILGEIVRATAPHTEAHPAAILGQLLVAFGNVVGPSPFFRVGSTKHHTNLFMAVVGRTSRSRKGTAWDYVRDLLTEADPHWARSCIAGGLNSGEGVIHALRDARAGDQGSDDKRLFIVETEFGSALRAGGRAGNTLFPVLRQAWDCTSLHVLTRNTPATATEPHLPIVAHITSDELHAALQRVEIASGFANRFLWVSADRVRMLPHGGHLDEKTRADLVRKLKSSIAFTKANAEMTFSEKGANLWSKIYAEISHDEPGQFGLATSRAEAQTLRLAAIYALSDRSSKIRLAHLRAAESFWRYCRASAHLAFALPTNTHVVNRLRALFDAHPDGVSLTELSAGLGHHLQASKLEAHLEALRKSNQIRKEVVKTKGRPRTVYFRNKGSGA